MTRLPLPPSLYADTAVAPVATPPLDVDKNVAVAIIGGGYTGLSTALHWPSRASTPWCWRRRSRVGARRATMAATQSGLKHDPDQIEADFGADLGRR
nr:hypothetical protein FJN17_33960 [Bradyrhizobium symbiodeficiens]